MRSSRLVLLAVVAAAVVALGMSFDGRPVRTSNDLAPSPIATARRPGALSSTWFCAAGGAGTEEAPKHVVFLVNPGGEAASAKLTAYNADGVVGEKVVDVTAPGPTRVGVNAAFGATGLSVVVESDAAELVVEHRLYTSTAGDQVPCSTSSSDSWYFPAQTTLRNTAAQLHLFNPFSADASVDISAAVADGVREPPEWQGLVVPAGTSRVIDLGVGAQRRDQFAVTVQTRNGQVVAETAQSLATAAEGDVPATSGLRLQIGVPRAAADWSFAQGFTGTGAQERVVVYNPGDSPADVAVQVTPYGASELPPEPFEIKVAARGYSVVDLSAETRVPGEGLHAIRVQTDVTTPVVAGRVVTITGPRADPSSPEIYPRPALSRGTAVGTGTPVAATLWAATGVDVGGRQESAVLIHNPSSTAAVVTVTVLGGNGDGTILADAVEVAPGDSVAVGTAGQKLGSSEVSLLVESEAPVVVERTLTFAAQDDLSMGMAVPLPARRGDTAPVGR